MYVVSAESAGVCELQSSCDSFPLLSILQFYLTSMGGQLKQSMDEKDKGWVNWKVLTTSLMLGYLFIYEMLGVGHETKTPNVVIFMAISPPPTTTKYLPSLTVGSKDFHHIWYQRSTWL